jgi:catechol 2,3-dioxygenase-like lactoylglutathione lyase family enzyme
MSMAVASISRISDVCLLVENIERTVEFYVDKLGLRLRRRAEGFADFHGDGVTLAAWEIDHIGQHTGVSKLRSPRHAHKVCVAVQLDAPGEIDRLHAELTAKGVPFYGPPENYVWNARCAYFTDPDDTLWELYAWLDGGPGDYHDEQP